MLTSSDPLPARFSSTNRLWPPGAVSRPPFGGNGWRHFGCRLWGEWHQRIIWSASTTLTTPTCETRPAWQLGSHLWEGSKQRHLWPTAAVALSWLAKWSKRKRNSVWHGYKTILDYQTTGKMEQTQIYSDLHDFHHPKKRYVGIFCSNFYLTIHFQGELRHTVIIIEAVKIRVPKKPPFGKRKKSLTNDQIGHGQWFAGVLLDA